MGTHIRIIKSVLVFSYPIVLSGYILLISCKIIKLLGLLTILKSVKIWLLRLSMSGPVDPGNTSGNLPKNINLSSRKLRVNISRGKKNN